MSKINLIQLSREVEDAAVALKQATETLEGYKAKQGEFQVIKDAEGTDCFAVPMTLNIRRCCTCVLVPFKEVSHLDVIMSGVGRDVREFFDQRCENLGVRR